MHLKDTGTIANSIGPDQTAPLILLHSEQPKLHRVLDVLSAIGLKAVISGSPLFA